VRSKRVEKVSSRHPRDSAALSQPVLHAHLEQRLLRALLLIPMGEGARYRCLRLVPGTRRADEAERRSVPQAHPVARRAAGLRRDVSRIPRTRSDRGSAAKGTRALAFLI